MSKFLDLDGLTYYTKKLHSKDLDEFGTIPTYYYETAPKISDLPQTPALVILKNGSVYLAQAD